MTGQVRSLALGVLLAGFEGDTAIPRWLNPLLDDGLAGVTLFGRNVNKDDPIGGLARLSTQLRGRRPDLLVSIDEEGGDVTRLETSGGSMTLGQASLGQIDDEEITTHSAELLAARLHAAGINVNFAPVADLSSERNNPVVGARAFSADAHTAARHVAASIRGYRGSGVAPAAKHFPGHGGTVDDSHLVLPVVSADAQLLRSRELVPFKAAIAAGVPIIMTGHLLVPALDPVQPATLSRPILTDLLRVELGFDGVIITDGMDMYAISRGIGRAEGSVQALAAGADLICIGGDSVTREAVEEIVTRIEAAVGQGRLPLGRLAEAQDRVAALARDHWHTTRPVRPQATDGSLRAAARRSLRVVGDPRIGAGTVAVVELYNTPTIVAGDVAFGVGAPLAAARDGEVLIARIEEGDPLPEVSADAVVVSVRASHLHPWQAEAVGRLRALHPDLVVVDHGATGDGELLGERAVIAHDTSAIAAQAAVGVLLGSAGQAEAV